MKNEEGKITVTKQFRKGKVIRGETEDAEALEVVTFPDNVEPAHISYGMGRTLNLGNFESYRADIRVTLPCCVEEIEDAFDTARQIAVERMTQELAAVDQLRSR